MTTTKTPRARKAPASDSTQESTSARVEARATALAEPKNPRNAAYSCAERRLREAHPDEFQALLREETEKLGLEYRPKMTKEERQARLLQERKAKAAAKIAALVAEFGDDVLASEHVGIIVGGGTTEAVASADAWS